MVQIENLGPIGVEKTKSPVTRFKITTCLKRNLYQHLFEVSTRFTPLQVHKHLNENGLINKPLSHLLITYVNAQTNVIMHNRFTQATFTYVNDSKQTTPKLSKGYHLFPHTCHKIQNNESSIYKMWML